MLTLSTIKRARRIAAAYGDTTEHFFDGRNDPGPPRFFRVGRTAPTPAQRSGWVRRWDDGKGAYVYVEVTRPDSV